MCFFGVIFDKENIEYLSDNYYINLGKKLKVIFEKMRKSMVIKREKLKGDLFCTERI